MEIEDELHTLCLLLDDAFSDYAGAEVKERKARARYEEFGVRLVEAEANLAELKKRQELSGAFKRKDLAMRVKTSEEEVRKIRSMKQTKYKTLDAAKKFKRERDRLEEVRKVALNEAFTVNYWDDSDSVKQAEREYAKLQEEARVQELGLTILRKCQQKLNWGLNDARLAMCCNGNTASKSNATAQFERAKYAMAAAIDDFSLAVLSNPQLKGDMEGESILSMQPNYVFKDYWSGGWNAPGLRLLLSDATALERDILKLIKDIQKAEALQSIRFLAVRNPKEEAFLRLKREVTNMEQRRMSLLREHAPRTVP